MGQSCPISLKNIDSNIIRLIALQTTSVAIIFLISKLPIFAIILLYDFAVRGVKLPKLSPFAIIAKIVVKALKLKPNLTDEAPKRFALFLGLLILIIINIFIFLKMINIALIVMYILIFCASLEAFFDYCIGCKIYQILTSF